MFFKQVCHLQGWKDAAACCFKCVCDATGLHECGPDVEWRKRLLTHLEWLALMAASSRFFPLLGVPGFTIHTVCPDLMHCGDLGVLLVVIGNILWDLFVEMGGTFTVFRVAMGNLNQLIQLASTKLDIRKPIGKLTLPMVRVKSKPPKLKSKAYESRKMLEVVDFLLLPTGC